MQIENNQAFTILTLSSPFVFLSPMLQPDYTYISFDFETTGLDVQRDEPIQIGIVKFDHTFQIIETFQSLIKPRKSIKELRSIVTFLTGFDLQQLETAPTIEEILPQISHYFTPHTIIVGQNVSFDLAILQNYLSFTPAAIIDTFPLAKSFLHFLPSYALDVVYEHLQKTAVSPHPLHIAHDALHDSLAALRLLQKFMERLTELRHHYLLLDYLIQQSEGILHQITKRTEKPFTFESKQLFLPALRKPSTTNKRTITTDLITLPKGQSHYTRNVAAWTFTTLLQKIDRSQGAYLLVFSHPSKLQLAEQILDQLHLPNARLQDHVLLDPELVNKFLQQPRFTDEEILFVMKYYSQYELGHSFLDINSASDRKIYHAITTKQPPKKNSLSLTTHYQLFELAEHVTPDQQVLFFDHGWWYQQFSKWIGQPFDSLQMLTFIDQLAYKYRLHGKTDVTDSLTSYLDQLTILIGVMSTEIDKLFIGYGQPKLEIENIQHNPRFPKTTSLLTQLSEATWKLLPLLYETDRHHLEHHLSKLLTYTEEPCEVEKRMYEGNKRYYLLHHAHSYVGYDEFLDLLPSATYHFISPTPAKEALPLHGAPPGKGTPPQLLHTTLPDLLATQLTQTSTPQYVISSSKEASQTLFNLCVKQHLQERYTILAENITGGVGKNIFLATQSDKPVIFIGGYSFYLEALAKKFDFSHIYLYHIHGSMKDAIIQDLLWYAR